MVQVGANSSPDFSNAYGISVSRDLGTTSTDSNFVISKPNPIRTATSAWNFVSFAILMYLLVMVYRTT